MSDEPLVSYAQNGEDVVLWRALGDLRDGVYADLGGPDPSAASVTRLFADRGWRGVETSAEETVHFLRVDGPGLAELDLDHWRPWVLVVRTGGPGKGGEPGWEPRVLEAGYALTLFDGLSRFYVSADHPELIDQLSYPACALDGFEPAAQAELRATVQRQAEELLAAEEQALRWRGRAVGYWANSMAHAQASEEDTTAAVAKAERARSQAARDQRTLQEVRADRRRLRERIRRMSADIERLEGLIGTGAGQAPSRLRAVVKKVTRT